MQLYRIVFDTESMTYFEFQNALYELESSQYIALVPRAFGQSYRLSAAGENVLESFGKTIEESVFKKIEQYIHQNKQEMISEIKYPVEEAQLSDGTYKVNMSVQEETGSIFEISVNVPNHEMVETMQKSWESQSTGIFREILNRLLKE